jgi:hypothetical protein
MPNAMPNTGGGFMAGQGQGLRAMLHSAALLSLLLAAICTSSGLAFARRPAGSLR